MLTQRIRRGKPGVIKSYPFDLNRPYLHSSVFKPISQRQYSIVAVCIHKQSLQVCTITPRPYASTPVNAMAQWKPTATEENKRR